MERERLYDWSTAPDWAQWAAMDRNGKAYWYQSEPKKGAFYDYWILESDTDSLCEHFAYFLPTENWQNSLEQRPTDKDAVLPSEKQI